MSDSGMRLPKLISPCPIRDAVVGVQFESQLPPDAVFGVAYQALKDVFPQVEPLPILLLPANVRNADKSLEFQPHYRLLNKTTAVLIGPRNIAVGIRGDYPGWATLSANVKNAFELFNRTGIVSRTSRFGLRYINFFPFDVFPNLLLKISVKAESWDGEETFIKTILKGDGCKNLLQIGKGLTLADKPLESGSVIDIDSFTTETDGDFMSVLSNFIEAAHRSEKTLFFGVLKPEFLTTLNPVYEHAN
jgi:uncharacterized protein (TIGR04255 family)